MPGQYTNAAYREAPRDPWTPPTGIKSGDASAQGKQSVAVSAALDVSQRSQAGDAYSGGAFAYKSAQTAPSTTGEGAGAPPAAYNNWLIVGAVIATAAIVYFISRRKG